MAQEIEFGRTVEYTGRNGTGKCRGVFIETLLMVDGSRGCVSIRPVNSKRRPANCEIQVPLEHLKALAEALLVYVKSKKDKDA